MILLHLNIYKNINKKKKKKKDKHISKYLDFFLYLYNKYSHRKTWLKCKQSLTRIEVYTIKDKLQRFELQYMAAVRFLEKKKDNRN